MYVFLTFQTSQVYEGERAQTKNNTLLGSVELSGISPAPHGVAQISVTFDIDGEKEIRVSAEDLSKGAKVQIVLPSNKVRYCVILFWSQFGQTAIFFGRSISESKPALH
jgi:hypothetical protein